VTAHGMRAGHGFGIGRWGTQPAALLSAGPTRFGACLAVGHVMPGAFLRAGKAYVGADGANCAVVGATACHEAQGKPAQLGAVQVERNATRHEAWVRLLQATDGAMIAGDCTCVTGLDARQMIVMSHLELSRHVAANAACTAPCGAIPAPGKQNAISARRHAAPSSGRSVMARRECGPPAYEHTPACHRRSFRRCRNPYREDSDPWPRYRHCPARQVNEERDLPLGDLLRSRGRDSMLLTTH
jgi:hypothetical protein